MEGVGQLSANFSLYEVMIVKVQTYTAITNLQIITKIIANVNTCPVRIPDAKGFNKY